jgi:hypothetical protein
MAFISRSPVLALSECPPRALLTKVIRGAEFDRIAAKMRQCLIIAVASKKRASGGKSV